MPHKRFTFMFAAAMVLVAGCETSSGPRLSLSFSWESEPPTEALWATFTVRSGASEGTRGPIVASLAPQLFDPSSGLAAGPLTLPFGDDLQLTAELRQSALSEQRVLYYGRSAAFNFNSDASGTLNVSVGLRAPLTETGNTLTVTRADGTPAEGISTRELDSVLVQTRSLNAVWIELANNATFADSTRFHAQGTELAGQNEQAEQVATCGAGEDPSACELSWDLNDGNTSDNPNVFIVYARFEDEAGYQSPTIRYELVVDGTPPTCVSSLVIPAPQQGRVYVTDTDQPQAFFYFDEDVADDVTLSLDGVAQTDVGDAIEISEDRVRITFGCLDGDVSPPSTVGIDCDCDASGACDGAVPVSLTAADLAGNTTTCLLPVEVVGDRVAPLPADVQKVIDIATHQRAPWGSGDGPSPRFELALGDEPDGLGEIESLTIWATVASDCVNAAPVDSVPWSSIWSAQGVADPLRFASSTSLICLSLTDKAGNQSAVRAADGGGWERPPALVRRGTLTVSPRDNDVPSPLQFEQWHALHPLLFSQDIELGDSDALATPGDGHSVTTSGAPLWTRLSDAQHEDQTIGIRGYLAFDAARGQLWRGQRCLDAGGGLDCQELDTRPGYFNGHVWTNFDAADPEVDGDPMATYGQLAVYDPERAGIVVFGGWIADASSAVVNKDTWVWTGSSWRLLTLGADTPEFARDLHDPKLIYDTIRREPVLIASGTLNNDPIALFRLGADDRWHPIPWTGLGPAARPGAAAAFDEGSGEIVFMGGSNGLSNTCGGTLNAVAGTVSPELLEPCDRVWRFDRASGSWTVTADAERPPARLWPALAYHRTNQQLVHIGGCDLTFPFGNCHNDVWQHDANGWQQIIPPDDPLVEDDTPTDSVFASAVFDPIRGEVVYSAGYTPCFGNGCPAGSTSATAFPGLWSWDGSKWKTLVSLTSTPPASASGVAVGAYEGGMVTFGGRPVDADDPCAAASVSNRTNIWDGLSWQLLPLASDRAEPGFDATILSIPNGPLPEDQRLMLIDGGVTECTVDGDGECACGDVYTQRAWEFVDEKWLQRPALTPGLAAMAAAAAPNGNTFFFGGYDNQTPCAGPDGVSLSGWADPEVCAYSSLYASTDFPDSSVSIRLTSAAARVGAAMVYDTARSELVLFGGTSAAANDATTLTASTDNAVQIDFTPYVPAPDEPQPDLRQSPSLVYAEFAQSVLLFGGFVSDSYICDGEWTTGHCRTPWQWKGDGWTQLTDEDTAYGDDSGFAAVGTGTDGAVWDRFQQRALVLLGTDKLDEAGIARAELHSWQVPADFGPAHVIRLPRDAVGGDEVHIESVTLRAETGGQGGASSTTGVRLNVWQLWEWRPLNWATTAQGGPDDMGAYESEPITGDQGAFNTLNTLHLALTSAKPNGIGDGVARLSTGLIELQVDYTVEPQTMATP